MPLIPCQNCHGKLLKLVILEKVRRLSVHLFGEIITLLSTCHGMEIYTGNPCLNT